MAALQSGVWGIDVGQCGVKALRLEQDGDEITATAFDYIEYPKILTQPDADPDQLIREGLEQFLSRNSLRGDAVIISVPGQSGLARFVKLPPVEEKKIADIVKFEAKQQIPFPLEEVVWDFQKLGSGEVTDGFAMGTEIGLFALKRDMVFRYLQHFKDVGIEVHTVQMAPLSLCNFVAFDLIAKESEGAADDDADPGKKKCVVALDIGTDNSNLVITDGDRIIWQRPIPLGGNHFTRALSKDMKLTFAKAEHLKKNAVKSPDLRKILSSLKTVLNDFVGEVQRSLGYFTNTHRDAKVQYMIGLGNAFRLPGLQKYLQEKLQLEVRKFTRLGRVEGEEVTSAPTFVENLPSFAVAYGLALQGLNKTRLTTNLLPYEVHVERLVRGKKPWAVAAAASLLLAVAGLAFARGMEFSELTAPEVKAEIDNADKILKEKAKYDSDYKTSNADLEASKLSLRNLAGGVDERFNWQLLHQYINMSLPQPNGGRLSDKSRFALEGGAIGTYLTPPAKQAFTYLEKKRFADLNNTVDIVEEKRQEEIIKKHLIQVNIETIDSRYSEDLGPFYKNSYNLSNELLGLGFEEKNRVVKFATTGDKGTPPLLMKGWVIEVRGYTYHEKAEEFVKHTFLENLYEPDNLPENRELLNEPFRRGGQGATAEATVTGGAITSIKLSAGGSGYATAPSVTFVGGEGSGAEAVADINPAGAVVSVMVKNSGSNYKTPPTVRIQARTLRDVMEERVIKLKSCMFLVSWKNENPTVGAFDYIGKNWAETLLQGGGAAAPEKGGVPPVGGQPAAGAKLAGSGRTSWKPIASAVGGKAGGSAKVGFPRTEFVLLFVWDEPFLAAAGSGGAPVVQPSGQAPVAPVAPAKK